MAPVNDLDEALADPQIVARGLVGETAGGPHLGLPFHLPGAPEAPLTDGPTPSADTDAILTELGLTPDEIGALRTAGAI